MRSSNCLKLKLLAIFVILVAMTVIPIFANENNLSEDPKISIEKYNLSYEGCVHILYAVDTNVSPDDVEMLFFKEMPESLDQTPDFIDTEAKEYEGADTVYPCVFKSHGIASKDAPDEIYAVARIKNTNIYSNLVKYSVLEYLYKRLNTQGITEIQEKFYNDFMTYCESAQLLLDHDTDNLPSSFTAINIVGGTATDGFGNGLFKIGSQVTVTATSDDFTAWIDNDGNIVSSDKSMTVTLDKFERYRAVSAVNIGFDTNSDLSTLSASPFATASGYSDSDYVERTANISAMDGYSLALNSLRIETTSCGSYYNTTLSDAPQSRATASIDLYLNSRDINFTGEDFGNGKLNEVVGDFFTVSGKTELYRLLFNFTKDHCVEISLAIVKGDNGRVCGFCPAINDENGNLLLLSEEYISLDKKCTLSIEFSSEDNLAAIYLDGKLLKTLDSFTSYGKDICAISIATTKYTNGSVYIDNLKLIK